MSRRPAARVLAATLIGLVLVVPHGAAVAQSLRVPEGIFSLAAVNSPARPEILGHPLIAGVSIRTRWQDVEPAPDVHDWSFLDGEVARARLAGKRVLLRVIAGGLNTPRWLLETGVQTFSFVDKNPYRPTFGTVVTIPVFWDPAFLARKKALIAAMGEHFTGQDGVTVVAVSCANATSGDWHVPTAPEDVAQWRALGYTADHLVGACRETVDAAMTAFPAQVVSLALGQTGALDSDPGEVARRVVESARADHPGRFVAQKNSLSATTPDPRRTTRLGAWQLILDSRPEVAGQMLWGVTGDDTCRMNGGVAPCDPAAVLQQAVAIGRAYDARYEEIYEEDLANPALADVVTQAADLLSRPTVPADLRAAVLRTGRVRLRWPASSDLVGVVGYRIYRDGVRVGRAKVAMYTDKLAMTPGESRTYEVSALDAAGNESGRSAAAVVTLHGLGGP